MAYVYVRDGNTVNCSTITYNKSTLKYHLSPWENVHEFGFNRFGFLF